MTDINGNELDEPYYGIKVNRVTLLELLPENLRSDPDIIAASCGVDSEFQDLADAINKCITIADIDKARSEVIDNLAGEMNVDFYDQKLSLDNRRELVRNGYKFKYRKGTAYAVRQIVKDAFADTELKDAFEVKEWFQYNGKPYHFKISTKVNLPGVSKITSVVNAINSVKNARSTLESIEAIKRAELKGYYGFGVKQTYYHSVALNLLTWNELDALDLTWEEFDAKNITWVELEAFQ